eukprot:GEZU01010967.1.p2 GENE.GEZU01010967.1~~GEZU01010967.1.p2  ORF type:complete len:209 (+),score=60.00 GEZU01010967.1:121-747(+)
MSFDIFRLVEVRQYPRSAFTPGTLLSLTRSWLISQGYEKIKDVPPKRGLFRGKEARAAASHQYYLQASKKGLNFNFVPRVSIGIDVVGDYINATLTHWARVRKIGIAGAFITEGITAVIGAGTLAHHRIKAEEFMATLWAYIDQSTHGARYNVLTRHGFSDAEQQELLNEQRQYMTTDEKQQYIGQQMQQQPYTTTTTTSSTYQWKQA